MIEPSSFAIHVTYTCPLACAHCCFGSNPANKDRLPIELIMGSIERLPGLGVQMVAFTGGEPFLLREKLPVAVSAAKRLGLTTRVVTSGHWATSQREAERRLAAFNGDLDELSISWDDYHEAFVGFANVRNAFEAALAHKIEPAVSIVQAADSRWTAERVRAELGLAAGSVRVVFESPLNLTGRAEEELSGAGLRPSRTLGPCPYVLTGPTLSAKGKLLACCGVIPETDALVIDDQPTPDSLAPSVERAQRSVLLNWLHLRGPYQIMQWLADRFDFKLPSADSIGGNCEACRRLFESEAYAGVLDEALCEQSESIAHELFVLESVGLHRPANILELWRENSLIGDLPPQSLGKGAAHHGGNSKQPSEPSGRWKDNRAENDDAAQSRSQQGAA